MLKVVERKTQRTGVANEIDGGRYGIVFNDGESKEVANSTFKRLFTVTGQEVEEHMSENETPVQEDAPEVEPENTTIEEEQESPDDEEALNELLAGAQEVASDNVQVQEAPSQPQATKDEEKKKAVEDLGLNIEIVDWCMHGTRGGKTDKVTSQIKIKEYLMEITEYAGYITDVRLFEENPDAPIEDPDAKWKLAYRSVKMSLRDTLQWLGLNEDDMKIARKEITAIRKAVKQAHLEAKEQ